MAAPVCHIGPTQAAAELAAKGQDRPILGKLPSIPVATDLPSALAALVAVRETLQQITKRPTTGNGFRGFSQNASVLPSNNKRWSEAHRTTEKVKITNPDDATQFVEVERINKLTMVDSQTGEQWEWKR